MEYIKLSQWAKRNKLTYVSAYNHYKRGLIDNIKVLKTGTVLVGIKDEQTSTNNISNKSVILYSRVSSNQMKDNLIRQDQRLYDYAISNGFNVIDRILEVGSGMNDHRNKLIKLFQRDDWKYLIVEHKDRLTRFGFNYIETLLNRLNKEIIVIDQSIEDKNDIMSDLISIIYSFSARIYGKRRNKVNIDKIVEQLKCN